MPPAVSIRKIGFLLFGPMMVESLLTMLSAWLILASYTRGLPPRQVMFITVFSSAAYCVSSLLAGRWVTPGRAAWLTLTAPLAVLTVAVATLGAAGGFAEVLTDAVWFAAIVAGSAAMSACIGHYYVPFQINMSHVQPFRRLAWSVAFYNIAWGTGSSLGPAIGGLMKARPWFVVLIAAAVVVAIHTALSMMARTAPSGAEHHLTAAFTSTPRQRRMGWISFMAVAILMRGIYGVLLPGLAQSRGWSQEWIALALALLYAPIPLLAPVWAMLRYRIEKPWILIGVLLSGAAGVLLMPLAPTYALTLLCVFCCGVADSGAVFHAVYYANADRPATRSKSIGMLEGAAGIGFPIGSLLAGLAAWNDPTALRAYLALGGVMLAAVVLVLYIWLRTPGTSGTPGTPDATRHADPQQP